MGPPYVKYCARRFMRLIFQAAALFNPKTGVRRLPAAMFSASTELSGPAVYDPVLDRMLVGWPNSGNTTYIFDEDTKTCTTQTFANGPTNSASSTDGTFGRFQYFPGELYYQYALVTTVSLDAFTLKLSQLHHRH